MESDDEDSLGLRGERHVRGTPVVAARERLVQSRLGEQPAEVAGRHGASHVSGVVEGLQGAVRVGRLGQDERAEHRHHVVDLALGLREDFPDRDVVGRGEGEGVVLGQVVAAAGGDPVDIVQPVQRGGMPASILVPHPAFTTNGR
ncbi:hypothetical protein [Streptomyces sp. NPDC051132]|uniref:hypothetical protein n=1 Tax=unclassified Streptomyces TaxID=2593676 RepID=UPI0034173109